MLDVFTIGAGLCWMCSLLKLIYVGCVHYWSWSMLDVFTIGAGLCWMCSLLELVQVRHAEVRSQGLITADQLVAEWKYLK